MDSPTAIAYLSADVLELTGVSELYLSFLVRAGIVTPAKHRNRKTNLFSLTDVDRVRWAAAHRGTLSIPDIRRQLHEAGVR